MAGEQKKAGKPKSAGKRSAKIVRYYDSVLPKRKLRRTLIHLLMYLSNPEEAKKLAKAHGAEKVFDQMIASPRFVNLGARRQIRRDAAIARRNKRREARRGKE